MKRIIHPNCSELVTHLGIKNPTAIREVLKEVEQITGWKIGIVSYVTLGSMFPFVDEPSVKFRHLFIPVDANELTITNNTIGIDPKRLPILVEEMSELYTVCLYNRKTGAYLRITMGDGYCDRECLTFEAEQHCCTPDFPALAKIIEHYNSIWHTHDGGSPDDFEQWCEENGYPHLIKNFDY